MEPKGLRPKKAGPAFLGRSPLGATPCLLEHVSAIRNNPTTKAALKTNQLQTKNHKTKRPQNSKTMKLKGQKATKPQNHKPQNANRGQAQTLTKPGNPKNQGSLALMV
ncbi:hypothetical protein [Secundilactobacillus collinoides]|uniref:Uncharacterized protein n=1 Tax=Secundilactobacillus collinoides TaxID=33960 RepID=A0A161VKI7_SECCO|nr:hypothetical protein [Secundilactobacillus collinoides]KZL42844.1 hypothetical protein TY91_03085 [Secundilactobacillus collinoides]